MIRLWSNASFGKSRTGHQATPLASELAISLRSSWRNKARYDTVTTLARGSRCLSQVDIADIGFF